MAHTHDGIDWPTRLAAMRRADERTAEIDGGVARRLVELVAPDATVIDIGSGAGGMSVAFARALAERGGGQVVLVDAVPELLAAAAARVKEAAGGRVEVHEVRTDAASEELPDLVPAANLVWAARVVHHLPDQQRGIVGLVRLLAPGGWLALGEGGLAMRCLPWDVGVGEPGLADRLEAVHRAWFADMRAAMPGVVRMPIGWTKALAVAGLVETSSFSYLIDFPAPAAESVRQSVVDHLGWFSTVAEDRLDESDRAALARLLDPDDPAFAGARDDVFILSASTVHLGRKIGP